MAVDAAVAIIGDVDTAIAVRSIIFSTYTYRVILRRFSNSTAFSSSALNNNDDVDVVRPPLARNVFVDVVSISLRNLGGAARGHRVLLPSLSFSSLSPLPSSSFPSSSVDMVGVTWDTCNALPEYRPPHPWGQQYEEEESILDNAEEGGGCSFATSKSWGEYPALRSLETIVRAK